MFDLRTIKVSIAIIVAINSIATLSSEGGEANSKNPGKKQPIQVVCTTTSPITAPAIFVKEQVFLRTQSGVEAFNLNTSQCQWRFPAKTKTAVHRAILYSADDLIFVFEGQDIRNLNLIALRCCDGQKIWQQKIEGLVANVHSLIIQEHSLFVGTTSSLYAFHIETGKLLWKTVSMGKRYSDFTIWEGKLVARIPGSPKIVTYDTNNGNRDKVFHLEPLALDELILGKQKIYYVGTSFSNLVDHNPPRIQCDICAVTMVDFKNLWQQPLPERWFVDGGIHLYRDNLYAVVSEPSRKNSKFWKLDATSGKPIWKSRLRSIKNMTCKVSLAFYENRVFLSDGKNISFFDIATGKSTLIWQEENIQGVVVDDQKLYWPAGNRLYMLCRPCRPNDK